MANPNASKRACGVLQRGATRFPCRPRPLAWMLIACVLLACPWSVEGQSAKPLVPATSGDPARLVGVWEGRERFEEDLGTTLVFYSGGAMAMASGVMTNFRGQVIKDELVAQIESLSGFPQQLRIRATGDRMTYIMGDVPQQWVRVGKAVAGQPAWVGTWAFDSVASSHKSRKHTDPERLETEQLMRSNMRMVISADGSGRLRFPVSGDNGTYTVQGIKLTMQYGGRVSIASWRIDGNTLYLLYPDRQTETAFDRIQ